MDGNETDPIVAEVRAIRARQAARFNNDPAAIIRHAQAMQKASGRDYARYPPRRLLSTSARQDDIGILRR